MVKVKNNHGYLNKNVVFEDIFSNESLLSDVDEIKRKENLMTIIKQKSSSVKRILDNLKDNYRKKNLKAFALLTSIGLVGCLGVFAPLYLAGSVIPLYGLAVPIALPLISLVSTKIYFDIKYKRDYKEYMTEYKILEGRYTYEYSELLKLKGFEFEDDTEIRFENNKEVASSKSNTKQLITNKNTISRISINNEKFDKISSNLSNDKKISLSSQFKKICNLSNDIQKVEKEELNLQTEEIKVSEPVKEEKPARERDFAKDIEIFQLLRTSMDELYGYYKEGILQEKLIEKYNDDNYYIEVITEKVEDKAAKEKSLLLK